MALTPPDQHADTPPDQHAEPQSATEPEPPVSVAPPARAIPGRQFPRPRWRRVTTLADRFDSRSNAIGLLRHLLALSVLVAHCWQLGYGVFNPTQSWWHGQTELGGLGVFGFFVLSGYLITGSALRFSLGRYAWHRALRILPGLWVCLAVCAFAFAPIMALAAGQGPRQFWAATDSPARYLTVNLFASMDQTTISGLLANTPYGDGSPTAFNGPLWSLRYELLCYVGVGLLAVTAVLRRAKYVVPVVATAAWVVLLSRYLGAQPTAPQPIRGVAGPVPLLGSFSAHDLIILAFLFALGACVRLYQHRLPMHGAIALVAAVAFVGSLWHGYFLVIGLPAYAYLLLYAAVALPRRLRDVGRRNDYSYGLYIYAYPVQMSLALAGAPRLGLPVYLLLTVVGAFALAVPSWHLVERRAMGLKNWQFRAPAA